MFDPARVCGCPESLGDEAARLAILRSVAIYYTVRLHRADDSAWEVHPRFSGLFEVSINFVKHQISTGLFDKAQIEGGLETWEIRKV